MRIILVLLGALSLVPDLGVDMGSWQLQHCAWDFPIMAEQDDTT